MSNRENYEGQVFGTRKIIRNTCIDEDWIVIGKKIPKEKSKYRLAECLCCGRKMPVLINKLKTNPPKRCAFCSGINNQSQQLDTNNWTIYDDYCVLNISYKKEIVSCYIDKQDYDLVSSYIWRISQKKLKYYVISGSKDKMIYLHQLIIGEKPQKGYEIDHRDGNSLNNRRNNLRIVTRLQNIQNVNVRIDNQIGIRGISKASQYKYQVDFSFNKKRYYFPHWSSLEEAVYCRMYAEQYFDLHMLERNPLAQQYLTLPSNKQLKIKNLVESIINNAKATV